MRNARLLVPVLALLLLSCGSSSEPPASVASRYIAACNEGDRAAVLDLWATQVQGLAAMGEPCRWIPLEAEAGEGHQVGEARITGETATVEWRWGEPATAVRRIILAREEDGAWRVLTLEKVD